MDPSNSSGLSVRDAIKEQGCQILRELTLRVLSNIFRHAPEPCQQAAAHVAHLVMEPLTILIDGLPSRKAYAGRESSDYVDGWNDALGAAERVVQHVTKRLADEVGEDA